MQNQSMLLGPQDMWFCLNVHWDSCLDRKGGMDKTPRFHIQCALIGVVPLPGVRHHVVSGSCFRQRGYLFQHHSRRVRGLGDLQLLVALLGVGGGPRGGCDQPPGAVTKALLLSVHLLVAPHPSRQVSPESNRPHSSSYPARGSSLTPPPCFSFPVASSASASRGACNLCF